MSKRFIYQGFSALGLFVYSLVIAEVCVRVLQPQPLIPRYVTSTPYGVRGNIAHAVYHHKTPEVDVEYRINGQGMRADHDFPYEKPPGSCRVAMVGDSFFVGYELNLRDTIAQQIETGMRKLGYNVDVLNFAVSGFGTGEMLRTYEHQITKFSPDAVIFQWHHSDLNENLVSGLYEIKDDRLVATNRDYLPSISVQDALMKSWLYRAAADHSQLYSWLRESLALAVKRTLVWFGRLRAGEQPPAHASTEPTPVDSGQQVKAADDAARQYVGLLSARLLQQAQGEVEANHSAFLVVEIPWTRSRTVFETSWNQMPAEIIADVPVIHGKEILQPLAAPERKIFYERGHGHITPLAAGALASAVNEHLITLPQLTSCH
ncbi:MAG: SGNH/GDSL hydrolase family protein [Steroidobacteraceae bacterium]